MEAYFINSIPSINKGVDSKGRGTVTFGNPAGYLGLIDEAGLGFFAGGNFRGMIAPTFYDIDDADTLYELVNNLR